MEFENFKTDLGIFYRADCFDIFPQIESGSVDMILCDLPYGTTACKWDTILPFDKLWKEYERIIKPNGAIVLTANQPFTSALIMSNIKIFKYCWVWDKVNKTTGSLDCKTRPLRDYEDVVVFYKKQPVYNPQFREGGYVTRNYKGSKNTETLGFVNTKKDIGRTVKGLYPKRIIGIKSQKTKKLLHPTEKPVALFEYFIKTYTNEGDLVLDNCAGSCATGNAAENLGRRWICIEKEKQYFEAGVSRFK